MDHVADLLARHFPGSERELRVGGVSIREIADQFGTPLFVYDASVLDRKWTQLRETLPPEFSICYSVKANPNRTILRRFLDKGAGLEVASAGELAQALAAGCPPDRVLFAGPGKTASELEAALAAGIGEIHVESALEARRLIQVAHRLGVRARAGLRVNPGAEVQGGAMRMGGKPAPFGVDEESLDEVTDALMADCAVGVRGLHSFSGTQIPAATVPGNRDRRGSGV